VEDYLSEKEQWEWVKEKVRENAPAVLLAIALGAGAIFGWRWWQGHQDARRLEASARYMQMVRSLEGGDRSQALVLLGELERDYPRSPYSDQARLLAARMYVDEAQLDHAASELATVVEHSRDQELARVARERLARVQIAQGKPDSALATLGAVADPGAFGARFHSAQTAGAEAGDTALLQLKIADLESGAPKAAPTAATAPAPATGTPAAGK